MEINIGVKSATYEDGTKLSDVAAWNNYGTETIPPRPVFRMAAEKILSSEEFRKRMKAYLHNVAVYRLNNQGDLKEIELKFMVAIGQQVSAECKRIINGGSELISNAPETIKKKGFNQPLYETGLMVKNLGYEVIE